MRTLWPVTDPIQAEYESLRALALAMLTYAVQLRSALRSKDW